MRPVNLLPEEYRPRRASGALKGSAYAIIGILGLLLAAVALYVSTANKLTSSEQRTVRARHELAGAQRKVQGLQDFARFTSIKTTRISSVRSLAAVRFDWERLMRELALVLPDGMWLSGADVTTKPAQASTATTAAPTGPTAPTATLNGCARRQPDVARFMVRLRQVHAVEDVQLEDSAQAAGGSGGGAPSSSGPTGGADCGARYSFTLNVTFEPSATTPAAAAQKVPASLGGGE